MICSNQLLIVEELLNELLLKIETHSLNQLCDL